MGYKLLITSLAPYGIIDIPAVLVASGLGVQVGQAVLLRFVVSAQWHEVSEVLVCGLKTYAQFILPALLVASVIEVLVTPLFIDPATI